MYQRFVSTCKVEKLHSLQIMYQHHRQLNSVSCFCFLSNNFASNFYKNTFGGLNCKNFEVESNFTQKKRQLFISLFLFNQFFFPARIPWSTAHPHMWRGTGSESQVSATHDTWPVRKTQTCPSGSAQETSLAESSLPLYQHNEKQRKLS
jgi:hypothetical protein